MSEETRMYELECLRLAADCTQLASEVHNRELKQHFLASDVHNRALEVHFLKMAKEWTGRAEKCADGCYNETIR